MKKLLIRWASVSFSLFVAAWLIPGIVVESNGWMVYAGMAVVLGLMNASIRPLLKLLTCPLIILTLGLFTLVINGITLWLASVVANWLGVGFIVENFWAAFWGAIIVSVVSVLLTMFVKDDDDD